ncbi:hypothetical protein [Rhodococcus sp. NPDC003383]
MKRNARRIVIDAADRHAGQVAADTAEPAPLLSERDVVDQYQSTSEPLNPDVICELIPVE